MSEPHEYEIRSVTDFLAVPPERRDDCLSDFATWLDLASVLASLLDPGVATMRTDRFVWIDGGEHDAIVRVSVAAPTTESQERP